MLALPGHTTGQADLPHPALGQDLTPSPTARRVRARLDVRARSARRGARVDKSTPSRISAPEVLEAVRAQLSVPDRVRDVLVAEIALNCPRVLASRGQRVAGS